MMDFLIIIVATGLIILIFRKHYLIMKKEQMFSSVLENPAEKAEDSAESSAEASESEERIFPATHKQTQIHDFSKVNTSFRKADYHFARGEWEEAEKWFIKTLSLYANHQEALNRLGVIYIQNKQPHKAELLFRRLLTLNQKEAVYFSNFGRCLYNQKKYEAAAQAYESAVSLDDTRAARFISLGQIYYEMKNFDKALANFLKAYEREPKNIHYLQSVADLYEAKGDTKNQKVFLEKILEIEPYNERVKEKLAQFKG